MRLLLLRHGPADERDPFRWPDDRLRPLTAKGLERTRAAIRGMLRLESKPDAIWTSPLRRAEQTAQAVAELAGGEAAFETHETLAPGGSYRTLMDQLAAAQDTKLLVLVGHEPDLGKLAGVLLFGAPAALPLKKAGACCIDFDDPPAPALGRLRWFLPARTLARLAGARSRA
jgi:phosphohistidine phosphatase